MLLFKRLHLLSLALLCSKGVFGSEYRISTTSGFSSFVANVNSGKAYYSGTTVYLDSDLSFSDKTLKPIGISYSNCFRGVFDGQGHVISDLKMNYSTSEFTGLFGFSYGLTIRNVVLDSSCSVTSSFSGSNNANVGGIIGECYGHSSESIIENSVNMADVTFSGDISGDISGSVYSLYLGGIAGFITVSGHDAYVKNCANYGSVTNSGISDFKSCLGGVVGFVTNSDTKYIQNCLNYGTITPNGTISGSLYIGGIVGSSAYYTYIENCVSAGKIVTQTTASSTSYIGSIVGQVKSNAYINYCYYTYDVGVSSINGSGSPSSTTGTPDSTTDVNSDLVSKLNINATSCNWNKWFLNANKATVTFKMSDDKDLSFSSQIILIPNPVKEGYTLSWHKDSECTEKFEAESVNGNTDLYAQWTANNYTVTFDFDNGTTVNEAFTYNTEIVYPDVKKEGCIFNQWSNYHKLMPAKNITITAQWTANKYIVTFDFDNGTTVNETFSYNTEIVYPKDVPEKKGHTLSWDNYHELMPAKNITITAQWTANNYTVTFDFGNGTTVNETFAYNTEIVYPDEEEGYALSWDNYHELMPAKNITITAQWTPNNYTVTFDANGGSVSETSKMVTFNEKYGNLPEPKKEGYMFIGWFTNETNGTEVTNETIVTTQVNHTLYAHWEEVTTQVEIVFGTKDLTEEEIKEIVKQYTTNTGFDIVKVEGEPGETRVIIKFTDTKSAEEFVRKVRESSDTGPSNIKGIDFTSGYHISFSSMLCPALLLNALLL